MCVGVGVVVSAGGEGIYVYTRAGMNKDLTALVEADGWELVCWCQC